MAQLAGREATEPHPLRLERLSRGLSQEALAAGAGLERRAVMRGERGRRLRPDTIRRLVRFLKRTPAELGLLPYGRVAGQARRPVVSAEVDDSEMQRRDVFAFLSVASGSIVWPGVHDVDWPRLGRAVAVPERLDSVVARDCGVLNRGLWEAYATALQPRMLLAPALEHLRRLTRLLRGARTEIMHRQLCALVAEAAQLVGVILHFGFNFGDAAAGCYSLAAGAAREARDYDLWTAALLRHAWIPLYDDRPTQALSLLQAATALARRGDSALPSRYWVAACSADAHAGMGDLTAWRTALAQAQDVVQKPDDERPAWLRFGYGQLLEEQGGSAVTAKQPAVAIPALEAALFYWPAPTYRRGLILIDLAGAAVQARDIERACAYGREVVAIAKQNAGLVSKELRCMEQHFLPCTSEPLVQELLQSIGPQRTR